MGIFLIRLYSTGSDPMGLAFRLIFLVLLALMLAISGIYCRRVRQSGEVIACPTRGRTVAFTAQSTPGDREL